MIEPAIALYGSTFQSVMKTLDELLRESGARYVMLLDRKGFVLAHKEALWAPRPPALDSLATLIAGNAAATQALAKMLGEQRFQEIVHQGEQNGLYIEEIGEVALLTILFDNTAPLGRVKLMAKKASETLEQLTREAIVAPNRMGIDTEYRDGANALLDELFGS